MKVRIGKALDIESNEVRFQLQFKFPDERKYIGFSFDIFKNKEDAQKALKMHMNGERVYQYVCSQEVIKRKVRGNHVSLDKKVVAHLLKADPLPESIIYVSL